MNQLPRRERERLELRAEILDAARELFAAEGYEAVTMRKIASKIEYSPTAIYFHFKDKESLIKELCDVDFRHFAERFQKIAKIADPVERLRRAGHSYVDFAIKYPNHFRVMFMTPRPQMEPEQSSLRQGDSSEDAYAFLRAIILDIRDAGQFRDEHTDVDLVAQTMWAGVHGVAALHIAKCSDSWCPWRPVQKRTRLMVDALVSGLTKD